MYSSHLLVFDVRVLSKFLHSRQSLFRYTFCHPSKTTSTALTRLRNDAFNDVMCTGRLRECRGLGASQHKSIIKERYHLTISDIIHDSMPCHSPDEQGILFNLNGSKAKSK